MPIAIEITNLNKSFSSRAFPWRKKCLTNALSNVYLKIEEGECLTLLGPNGAGKTTLIKILCSSLLPDSGDIIILGSNFNAKATYLKSNIGLVTGEERSFYWRLTARENLKFFGALYNLYSKNIDNRINELSELLQIKELNKPFYSLSTGIKHRIAIARALLHDPRIILMDEPTKSLDIENARKFRIFLKETLLKEMHKTIFLVTHNPSETEILADKIAIMDKGRVKIHGTLGEIRTTLNLNSTASLEEIYRNILK